MRHIRLYYPGDSWLHRLHPSAKLLLLVWLAFVLAALPWQLNAAVVLGLFVGLRSTGTPFAHYWLFVLLSAPVMVVSLLLNAVSPSLGTEHVVGSFPWYWPALTDGGLALGRTEVPLYYEGLRRGLNRDFLIGGSMLLTIILLATTELSDLAEAPTYLGAPHVVGFTLAAILRYIPEVGNHLLTLYDVQESRGVNFYTRNPVSNFVRRTNILVPLLIFQLSRASRMSNAMESRGFQIGRAPTLYALRPMTGGERAAVIAIGLLTLALVLVRIYAGVVPGDYPFEFGTF